MSNISRVRGALCLPVVAAMLLLGVLPAASPSHAALTYFVSGVTGSETTFSGYATTYQTADTLQTLRVAGKLTITGPQGWCWNPGNGPIQANFCDAASSTDPGQTWPLADMTTHTLDFTFDDPAATAGYTLQGLSVFVHDWQAARSAYDFDVYYSTVAAPTTFVKIATAAIYVGVNPGDPPGSKVYLDCTQANLTGVETVRFVFRPGYWDMSAWLDEIDLSATPVVTDATAPTAVSNLAAGTLTAGSLTLTWTAPGDDGSTGTAASYDIRYSTSTISEGNWASATQVTGEPTPAVAGTNQNMTISGLSGDTTYYFAIKTADEVPNWSAISNCPSGTTTDTVAPAAVSNLATSSPTDTSITLTWTAPGDNGSTGTAAAYDIRYSTSTITDGNWASATQVTGEPTPAAAGTNQNMVVSGLTGGTTYYFAIKTSDEVPNASAISNCPSGATASQGGMTYYVSGISGSQSTYNNNATTYLTADIFQALRLASKLSISGPQGYAWNPGNGPIQANFCDAASSTDPGQSWPLSDLTTNTVDFTFNDSGATNGYTLQSLSVYVHDHYSGRSTADFDVSYSTVSAPTTFTMIATAITVASKTVDPGDVPGIRIYLDLAGGSLTNVATVRFVFRQMYYGFGTWLDEIDLSATPSSGGGGDTTAPGTVTNLAAGSPTSSSLTLTWTAPGDDGSTGTAASYDIRYSTSAINEDNWASATAVSGEPTPSAAGNSQNMTVSGLTPGTTYYFAMKTSDEVPNVSAISNSPSGITSSQGGMTYYISGVTGSQSTYDGYATTYLPSDTFQSLRSVGKLNISGPQGYAWNPGNGPIQANFCDAASTTNPGQSWPLSDFVTNTVDFTFNDPTASNGYNLQSLSVYVHDHISGRSTADFDVSYSTVSAPSTFTMIATAMTVTSKAVDPGDVPGTRIYLDLASANLTNVATVRFVFRPMYYGFGTWVDEIDLSATPSSGGSGDTTAPAAVTNLAAGNPTTTSITVSWTAPGDDGSTGTAAAYDIRYRTGGAINDGNWASATQCIGEPAPQAAGNNQSFVVNGLTPSTTYYFAIKTSDEVPNVSGISNSPSSTTASGGGGGKTLLTPRDFKYLGYYQLPWTVVNGNPTGFTHRYVDSQLRFLAGTWVLYEFAPPGSMGGTITAYTNSWSDIWTGANLPPPSTGALMGLWYEQAANRLWTTWAVEYNNTEEGQYTMSLNVRTLNSNGTISNMAGPWGLQGVQQRRIYGGMQALPSWFQTAYGAGPYAVGWGGYASHSTEGGWVSLGPTFYAIPEPTGYSAGNIPTSAFKTLMDHSAALDWADWYANGFPTDRDRGVRNADLKNDYDTWWQAPAPDGLGRWVWGDTNLNTGCWIETSTKHAFITVPKLASGRNWYYASQLNSERTTAEIQVFDPYMLGEAALGTRASWNTYPTHRWQITDLLLPLGFGRGLGAQTYVSGGVGGATYDATTQRLYVYCSGYYWEHNYILVYEIGNGNAPIDEVAVSETAVTGTVFGYGNGVTGLPGNRANTETADSVYEKVTEVVQGNTSQLEHKWTFNVTAGSSVVFKLKSFKTSNSEGDDFVFAYSTNGTTWTNMVTVSRTTDDGTFQTYTMPGGTSGTVYVRVQDADRTTGRNNLDTIYVDRMFFLSNP